MEKPSRSFYQLNYQERLEQIIKISHLDTKQEHLVRNSYSQVSEHLVENYLMDYDLPQGIMNNLKVNNKEYLIPMVTEEPSVVAAASYGAKMLGNMHAELKSNLLTGQVILQTDQIKLVRDYVENNRTKLLKCANLSHPSILNYGNGAADIYVRKLDAEFVSIDLDVDAGESMGANTMNSMLEALAVELECDLPGEIIMSVLTNYADKKVVTVTGSVDFADLSKDADGKQVAKKIALASHIAQIDYKRATTNNKGIMNGIDAAAIALGNDWRALESAVHAYAIKDGQYRGLTTWEINDDQLIGKIEIPIPIGFVGGATKVLTKARVNQIIADVKNVKETMQVLAAIGLAQNLAAVRALVSEGIQRGHMNLQYKSMALSNGAKPSEVVAVTQKLKALKHPSSRDVSKILNKIRK